jgi:metal-dependent amidase/aminoacylase/carboxypeptidase family protein
MGAEDFSFYQEKIQGYTFFLGGPKGKPISETAPHHTPDFILMKVVLFWNENHVKPTVDYMEMQSKNKTSKKK